MSKEIETTFAETAKYLSFPTGARIVVYGGSESGKTTLICKMLKTKLWYNNIDNVMYVNPMLQKGCMFRPEQTVKTLYQMYPNMCLSCEIPKFLSASFNEWLRIQKTKLRGDATHLLLFIDDFQSQLHKSVASLEDFFANAAHHANISIVITLQGGVCGTVKAQKMLNAIKTNITHCVLLHCDTNSQLFATIEKTHNPFKIYETQNKQKYKLGARLAMCLNVVENYMPNYAYIVLDFNPHAKSFNKKFPIWSLCCNEVEGIKGVLFPMNMNFDKCHPLNN